MHRASALCLAAVCFLSAGSANADLISYNFSSTPKVAFYPGTFSALGLYSTSGSTSTDPATISTHLAAFSLTNASAKQSVSLPIDLTLKDSAGHSTGPVQIGTLTGSVWDKGASLTFRAGTTSLKLDGHQYNLSPPSLTQVSGFGLTLGQLSFTMKDPPTNSLGGGSTSSVGGANTPEPASLLLAGIGVPLMGVFLRRKKR